jgi:hypothetical protein
MKTELKMKFKEKLAMEYLKSLKCVEIKEELEIKKLLSGYFKLEKKTMIQMLSCEKILVNNKYYKVPEQQLLNLLINGQYGETKLDLVEIC